MKKIFFYCAAAAALTLGSCSNEEVMELNKSNTISFRASFNEGVTGRGTETTTQDLSQFFVTALDKDFDYRPYFTDLRFVREGNFYESNPPYLWTQTANLDFYAYGYVPKIEGADIDPLLGCDAEVTVTGDQKTINNFRPNPNIADQIDLVYASTNSKITTGSVALNFHHILSEVAVQATTSSSLYKFDVLGLRYGNVGAEADYQMETGEWIVRQHEDWISEYNVIYEIGRAHV